MSGHPEDRLFPHLRGELSGPELAAVDRHLAHCAGCQETLAGFERLAGALATEPVPLPPGGWVAWRAGLSQGLASRPALRARAPGWRLLPVPALVAAALVAGLVYLGLPRGTHTGPGDMAVLEDALLASRLDLIARLEVIQRLPLLEDLDVIGRLDTLPPRGEG